MEISRIGLTPVVEIPVALILIAEMDPSAYTEGANIIFDCKVRPDVVCNSGSEVVFEEDAISIQPFS
ncbi:MAG TPA: hypothetical protein VLN72_08755, partial [Gillisia sp.]|nr:hypothetical protein [Gillisia sp.]